MKLEDLATQLDDLIEMVLETEEQENLLFQIESLYDDLKTKIDGYAYIHERYQLEIEATKAKIAWIENRYKGTLKRLEDGKKRIEDRLVVLNKLGFLGDKVKGHNYSLKFRDYPKVIVDNMDNLPEQFIREKIERKPDLNAIKKQLKAGGEVTGAELVENIRPNFTITTR